MRLEGIDPSRARWFIKPLLWMMRRRFGKVLRPTTVMAHRPGIVLGYTGMTYALESGGVVEPALKRMVCLRAAQMIGCVF